MKEAKALVVQRGNRRRHLRPVEREQIVVRWVQSGLSAAEVAQRTGVSPSSLWRWKGQLSTSARPMGTPVPALVEVPPPIGGLRVAEVMTRGGPVRLFAGASPAWAAALLRELNRC